MKTIMNTWWSFWYESCVTLQNSVITYWDKFLPYYVSDPEYRVRCSPNEMLVEIVDTESTTNFYLQHLKNYPGNVNLKFDDKFI